MPKFGERSRSRLEGVDWRLQLVCQFAIKLYDFTVIHGHRTVEEQQALWKKGRNAQGEIVDPSKVVTYIDGVEKKSEHNYMPSRAVDLAPWPVDWQATSRFYILAGIIMTIGWFLGSILGFRLRWGGDWDMDWDMKDQRFDDLGHFEILEVE